MITHIDPNHTQAILIGASEFDDEDLLDLPNVKTNLLKLNHLLHKVVGIEKNQIHLMLDKDNSDAITSQIIGIVPNALDTIIIYYAGHGIQLQKKLYLATKKTKGKKPQYTGAIESNGLIELVIQESKKVKNIIFIIDCCFSAIAKEGVYSRGKNVFFITAAPSNQSAKDESPEDTNYTAFTYELLVILEQGVENNREILTLQDIVAGLKERLKSKKLPLPQISSHGLLDELGICKNQAAQNITRSCVTPTQPKKNGNDSDLEFLKNIKLFGRSFIKSWLPLIGGLLFISMLYVVFLFVTNNTITKDVATKNTLERTRKGWEKIDWSQLQMEVKFLPYNSVLREDKAEGIKSSIVISVDNEHNKVICEVFPVPGYSWQEGKTESKLLNDERFLKSEWMQAFYDKSVELIGLAFASNEEQKETEELAFNRAEELAHLFIHYDLITPEHTFYTLNLGKFKEKNIGIKKYVVFVGILKREGKMLNEQHIKNCFDEHNKHPYSIKIPYSKFSKFQLINWIPNLN